MKTQWPRSKNKVMRLLLFLGLGIGFLFNNCGDVRLKGRETPGSSAIDPVVGVTPPSFSKLPQVSTLEVHPRLIVILDMSGSMIADTCSGDVDSDSPMPNPGTCDNQDGVDLYMHRLDMVKELINKNINRPNLKVLLTPISGPAGTFGDVSSFSNVYITPAQALEKIDKLKDIQQNNMLLGDGDYPAKMTTSVPAPAIMDAYSKIQSEMESFSTAGNLSKLQFEVLLISDGRLSPTVKHIIKAVELINTIMGTSQGCSVLTENDFLKFLLGLLPYPWPTTNPPGMAARFCKAQLVGEFGLWPSGSIGPVTSFWHERAWLPVMDEGWGLSAYNRVEVITTYLSAIKGLPKLQGGGETNIRLYAVHPELMSAEKLDKRTNWIQAARDKFFLDFYKEIVNDSAEEELFETYPSKEAFALKHSWLFNLNARVDANGRLRVDSDADGLFDDEEKGVYLPSKSRSNGTCLDRITKVFGCQTSVCKKDVDTDGDSLNECEEISIGTSDYDFDSDTDGIPDSIEVLFGTSPMRYDLTKDENFDGLSNYSNLQMGLHPNAIPSKVNESYKTKFRVSEGPDFTFALQIAGIPLVNTGVSDQNFPLLKSRGAATNLIPEHHQLVGGVHGVNEQSLLVLMSLEGKTTFTKKWFIKRVKATAGDQNIGFQASDLEFFYFRDQR